MARIAGVNIPSNKKVRIGLRYVYGIGPTRADEICSQLDIRDEKRVKDLTEAEVIRIREMIEDKYLVEGDLRREVYLSVKRLTDLGCYRGLRHRKRLPVRGQRTSCNAKTVRRVSPVSAH